MQLTVCYLSAFKMSALANKIIEIHRVLTTLLVYLQQALSLENLAVCIAVPIEEGTVIPSGITEEEMNDAIAQVMVLLDYSCTQQIQDDLCRPHAWKCAHIGGKLRQYCRMKIRSTYADNRASPLGQRSKAREARPDFCGVCGLDSKLLPSFLCRSGQSMTKR